jgi:hypothetical protein
MFGEKVEGYSVPVLNEREVRAGAGILFFLAITVFLGAWHADIMLPAQLMIIGFFTDFLIRVVQPKYSPSLILGRIAVSNQKPEYTAASPKRFAWGLGLALATFMIITLIFLQQMTVVNFTICGLCIGLLFLESSFGICLGCLVYSKILGREVILCPGDVCEIKKKEAIQEVNISQFALLVVFTIFMVGIFYIMDSQNKANPHNGPNHPFIQELKHQH